MAVSHIKNVTVADFTGTVTVFNSVGSTQTANATDLVRPTDWNSAHNQYFTLTGNTNNASTVSGSNVVLSGGNGVTLVGSNSVIGFSVATNYQSQGAYLTTAMESNRGSDFVQATAGFNGTNASGTIASNAISVSVARPAFSADASSTFQTLTFQDSNGVSFSNNAGAIRVTHGLQFTSNTSNITSNALHSSASRVINIVAATNNAGGGTASLSSNVSFSNANGVSFYTSAGGAIVGSVATSYRASNDAIGTNTAQSNVTWTANSGGLSLDARGYAGTGLTLNVTNMSTSATLNSNGLNLSINNVDDHPKGFSLVGNTAGTNSSQYTTTTNQVFSGGPNITLSGNSNTIVISGPSPGGTTFFTGSYFANMDNPQATTTMTFSGSTLHMASFSIQQNMSIDFIRVLATGSVLAASSTAATTGNTSYTGGSTKSHNLVLYTRGVGANSMSLQSYGSTQDTERAAWTISCAANSTQHSYSLRYTMNSNSGNVGFTKDYSSSAASLNFHSSQLTDMTGLKQMEIPFATLLTPGQYWLGYQVLTSMSTHRTADESRWGLVYSTYGATAPQLSFGVLGSATNSHFGLMPMVGSITTNATTTTASFPLTNITSSSNNAVMFFQGMRIT